MRTNSAESSEQVHPLYLSSHIWAGKVGRSKLGHVARKPNIFMRTAGVATQRIVIQSEENIKAKLNMCIISALLCPLQSTFNGLVANPEKRFSCG